MAAKSQAQPCTEWKDRLPTSPLTPSEHIEPLPRPMPWLGPVPVLPPVSSASVPIGTTLGSSYLLSVIC